MKIWMKRAIALSVVVLAAVAFYGGNSDAAKLAAKSLSIQPSFSIGFLVVAALTPLWGRFFCECLCPLGAVQSFIAWMIRPKSAVRRVCTRLPSTRGQLVVRWSVFAVFALACVCGFGAVAHMITPYSIFSKVLLLFAPGLVVFLLVAFSAFFGKGRIWCNWICPVGSLFSLLSVKSVMSHRVCKGCENCRKCFPQSNGDGSSKQDESKLGDVSRREALKGVAVLAAAHAADKIADGGLAPVSLPGIPDRPSSLLPPGAVPRAEFNLKCVGCGLCVTRCPSNVLRPSLDLKTFGQPEMYFQNGYCRLSCNYRCAAVCPTGAIMPRTKERANLHMGHAIWKKDICVRNVQGDSCTACVRNCPVKALHVVNGVVAVDKVVCVGCGACEHVCPARPEPAIAVKGFDRQREILPMGEADLVSEMFALIKAGESCVVAKNGVIVARDRNAGLKPLLRFLDEGTLEGALVVDKVIGRAAAAICVAGRVREVCANVMSAGAKALLERHGVKCCGSEMVKEIQNRAKTGLCPMETAVRGLDNPAEMVAALRKKFQ